MIAGNCGLCNDAHEIDSSETQDERGGEHGGGPGMVEPVGLDQTRPLFEPYLQPSFDEREVTFMAMFYSDVAKIISDTEASWSIGFDHYWLPFRKDTTGRPWVANFPLTYPTPLRGPNPMDPNRAWIHRVVDACVMVPEDSHWESGYWCFSMCGPHELNLGDVQAHLLWGRRRYHRQVSEYEFFDFDVRIGAERVLVDCVLHLGGRWNPKGYPLLRLDVVVPKWHAALDPRWGLPDLAQSERMRLDLEIEEWNEEGLVDHLAYEPDCSG